ncbi:MAG: SurA N-terminal domain-containing protein [Bacteriovoracia bacterium]
MKTYGNKVSYFILTFIFLIIIASFLFSNFDNFSMGSGGQVASVDGTPVTSREYQIALNRQVEFFNQMMGGQGLTQKQLEEMGIKQSVLNGLIQQKLILNLAEDMGIVVSLDEVKNEIKSMPYFQTNNQFDVNLYRNMLQGNGYIPAQFEELVANDLKQKKIDELFNSLLVSEDYVQDVVKFKNKEIVVNGVKISRQSLSPLVSVSEEEIKAYLAKPENQKNLEELYTENFAKYNTPAEVKARHILIQGDDAKALEKIKSLRSKVTPKNFAQVAEKETEDPSGKGKGGSLGWFSSGRMVPEFEKVAFNLKKGEISDPVKTQFGYHLIYVEDKKDAQTKPIEAVKPELAQMAIQKTKAQDLDKLLASTSEEIKNALEKGNFSQVEAIAKKVNGQVFKNTEVNQYDQNLGTTNLAPQEVEQLFKAPEGEIVNFGNPGTIFLVKVQEKKLEGTMKPEQMKPELASQTQLFSRRVREEMMKTMNNKAKVVTNPSLL